MLEYQNIEPKRIIGVTSNPTIKFLREDGTWSTLPNGVEGGGMTMIESDNRYLKLIGGQLSGALGIGINPTAQLEIKSTGNTAATTSLLIKSLGGTTLFQINDDGEVTGAKVSTSGAANALVKTSSTGHIKGYSLEAQSSVTAGGFLWTQSSKLLTNTDLLIINSDSNPMMVDALNYKVKGVAIFGSDSKVLDSVLSLNIPRKNESNKFTQFQYVAMATGSTALGIYVDGKPNASWYVNADGKHFFTNGDTSTTTTLYRAGDGVLKTDGRFIADYIDANYIKNPLSANNGTVLLNATNTGVELQTSNVAWVAAKSRHYQDSATGDIHQFVRGTTVVASVNPAGVITSNGGVINGNLNVSGKTSLLGVTTRYNQSTMRVFENLATYIGGSTSTGAIVIRTGITSSTMAQVRVRGYVYTNLKTTFDLTISGYGMSGTGSSVVYNSTYKPTAYWAEAGGVRYIVIGSVTDSYSFAKFWVEQAVLSHAATDAHGDNWSISFSTDLSTYGFTSTTTPGEERPFARVDSSNSFAGDIRINSSLLYLGIGNANIRDQSTFISVHGGATTSAPYGFKAGSLVVSSNYGYSAPTNGIYSEGQIKSAVTTGSGLPPFIVDSTNMVTNLNAQQVGGVDTTRLWFGDNTRKSFDLGNGAQGEIDTVLSSGVYRPSSVSANLPDGLHPHLLHLQHPTNDTFSAQIAVPYATNPELYLRRKSTGWSDWVKMWHSGNTSTLFTSPTFTGIPTAPTAAIGTNTTQIATTAFVLGQGFSKTTGTVTSIGLAMPSIFSVTGSPVTTSGTFTTSLVAQPANQVFAGPTSGANAVPAFRALVEGDLPLLSPGKIFDLQYTDSVQTNYNIVGQAHNLLLNATKRYTVTQTGGTIDLNLVFDGKLAAVTGTISDATLVTPHVIEIDNLPNVHTQVGGYVGWTTRYWELKRFKIEGYNVTPGSPTVNTWVTFADYSSTPYTKKYFSLKLPTSGQFTKLRLSVYEGSNGGNGTQYQLSSFFFVHPEAARPYDGLYQDKEDQRLSTTDNIAFAGATITNNIRFTSTSGSYIKTETNQNALFFPGGFAAQKVEVSSGLTVKPSSTANSPLSIIGFTGQTSSFLTSWLLETGGVLAAVRLNGNGVFNSVDIGLGGGNISTNTALGNDALAVNTTGATNVAVGQQTLVSNSTGTNNVGVGWRSLYLNATGSNNVAIGAQAAYTATAGDNTIIGHISGYDLTTGDGNTFLGFIAGRGITTGRRNTIIGANLNNLPATLSNTVIIGDGGGIQRLYIHNTGNTSIGYANNPVDSGFKLDVNGTVRFSGDALINGVKVGKGGTTTTVRNYVLGSTFNLAIATGQDSVSIGYYGMVATTTGYNNIGIGSYAMQDVTTGNNNVAIGNASLKSNLTGGSNIAIGTSALINATASVNTVVGAHSGGDITSGSGNTLIGYNTGRGITTGSLNTILGANVTGLSPTLSNHIIIADGNGNQRIVVDNTGVLKLNNIEVFDASSKLSDTALSGNVAFKNASNYFTVAQYSNRTLADDTAWFGKVGAEAVERFRLSVSGKLEWGDGVNARDTNLYRAAVGVLKTDGEFHSSAFRASTFSNLTSGNNAQVAPTNTGTEIRTAIINNVALKVINTDNTANGNLTEWIKGSTTVARITSAGRLAVADGIENIGGSGLTLRYNGSMYLTHTNGNNDFIMVGADTDPDMNFAYTSAKDVNAMIFQRRVTPIAGNTGAITFNAININNRVTYTNSGAGSLARGVYVNPVLVNVSDYRGIEMANNVGWGIYQTGASAKNYFAGNTLIGTTLDQGFKLDVSGNVRLSNTVTSSDILTLTSPLSAHNVSYVFSTDSAKKLIIQGTSASSTVFINQTDLHVKGTSNTSATNALSVMNSNSTSTFKVANNGDITGTNGIVKLGLWNGDGHQIGSLKIDYVSGNNPSISGVGGSINLDSTLIFGAGSTAQITTHTSKTNDLTLSHGRTNVDYGVRIQTYDGSNVYQTRFRVGAGSGAFAYFNTTNLGIGTTTDAGFRLDVNGTTRLNGAVTVGSLQVFDAAGNLADGTLSGNVAFKNIDNNFTLDQTINGLTVGKGGSNVPGNTVVGLNTLLSNTTGNYNVVLGHSASKLSTTASSNVAIGYESLMSQVSGSANVAVGRGTLRDYTGTNSQVAVGYHALNKLTTGAANTALGFAVMANATTGGYNSGVGYYALLNVTTGLYNSAFGVDALKNLTTSHYNVAIGNSTLATLTTGERNTAVGYAAGVLNNVGVQNTYVGFESGYNSTSNHNTFIGYQSGKPVTTGFLNTFIGHNSGSGITTGSYNTIIGSAANLLPTLANHIILSDGQGNQRMVIDNTGKWFFTSSKETNLYEDIPGTLRTDGTFRTGSSIISGGVIFATSGLSNGNTGANAMIIPSNTGTEIRTAVTGNVALKVINTVTSATGDLQEWVKGTATVAKIDSSGNLTITNAADARINLGGSAMYLGANYGLGTFNFNVNGENRLLIRNTIDAYKPTTIWDNLTVHNTGNTSIINLRTGIQYWRVESGTDKSFKIINETSSNSVPFAVTSANLIQINGSTTFDATGKLSDSALSSNVALRSSSNFWSATQAITRTNATDTALAHYFGASSQASFSIDVDGRFKWGVGGSTATDTNLYRVQAGRLKTDGGLDIVGSLLVGNIYSTTSGAYIQLASTGTTIQTSTSTNVALKTQNTVVSATGDLHQYITGTTTVAKVTADGFVDAAGFKIQGSNVIIKEITSVDPSLLLEIDGIPPSEIIKLDNPDFWDADGKYTGDPLVNCLQGTEYYTSDDKYYIRMRRDNDPKRMLIG